MEIFVIRLQELYGRIVTVQSYAIPYVVQDNLRQEDCETYHKQKIHKLLRDGMFPLFCFKFC